MVRCPEDDSFGPALLDLDGCYGFDFTLIFEDAIFGNAPCYIALLLAFPQLYLLLGRKPIIRWPLLRASKLLSFVTLAALQAAIIGLLKSGHGFRVRTTLPSAILAFITTIVLGLISDLEHARSLRPSLETAAVFTAAFALKVVVLIFESLQKFRHSTLSKNALSPEEYKGIFGRTFFTFLTPLFQKGFRQNLTMDDLWDVDDDLTGQSAHGRLSKHWLAANNKQKHGLAYAAFATFFPELAISSFPRLALVGFTLAQPFLVNTAILFVNDKNAPHSHGYGLIGAYAICYIGLALCTRWYNHMSYRTMAKLRAALVTMIYKNMLTVRAETGNSSSALSLMSTDVDRITTTCANLVDLAPSFIQLAISMYILGSRLGASCVAPVVLCVLFSAVAAFVGKLVPPRQRLWMAAIQKRVGITTGFISSMKGVKVAGLSDKAERQIQDLRNFELERSTQFRKIQLCALLLGVSPGVIMPAVTFTVFAIVQSVSGNSQFGVARAFTSLTVINLLFAPILALTTAWTNLASALACFDRIQDFLVQEKRKDYRTLVHHPVSATSRSEEASSKKSEEATKPCIEVRGGNFGWKDDTVVLHDIDMHVMPGELTLIIGPVASGKSTLLKALLGEARMYSGSVEFSVPEEIAYCDQDAWLLNRSVKENVLAYRPYKKDQYEQAIRACQLTQDIDQFPKRDDTMIGSEGVSLSGGQKQRVALARALYNRKPIVILDDILKGLDADTYTKCFAATLGPEGLFRKSNTAVILATHNVQILPYADHIVVLNEDGRIAQHGTFSTLNSTDGYVRDLKLKSAMEEAAVDEAKNIEVEIKEKESVLERIASAKSQQDREAEQDKGKPSRGKRNADALYTYIRSMGDSYFIIFVLLTICNVGFRSAQPVWLNEWTMANEKNPNGKVGFYVGIYAMFGALNFIFMVVQFWTFMIIIVPRTAKVLHQRILVAAMHAPLSFFVATDSGEIINRFSQDMTLVDMPLPMSFIMCCGQVIGTISQLILTCVASGYLALTIPVLLVVLYFLQKYYLRTSRQMRLLDLEAKSPLFSDFIASFSGLTALRAYGWARDAEEENLRRLNQSQKPFYLMYCIQRWLAVVLDLIVAALAVILIGLAVGLRDRINPGLLGVALTSVMGIGMTLNVLLMTWTMMETSLGAITRVIEFSRDTPQEINGPEMPPPNWPSQGAVVVQGLQAKYGNRVVLDNINLDIKAGEKVAICGRSGSGKSTLISLLLRLYHPSAGHIEIDGIDTERLHLNALREAVVALPQDPMFLAGSVRFNLDPLERATDEEMLQVLMRTHLREVVDEKGGLDADLDTDWLSAGQRQLFCMARAMLRKSKVLLLDEATSSLDLQTEETVNQLVHDDFHEWTVIVVAHRLRAVGDFDKVLVLQDGRAMEYDSPQTLLARESLFKNLWDLQEKS